VTRAPAEGGAVPLDRNRHARLEDLRQRLFGYAWALCRDTATAEDLYQDAMLRALGAASAPEDRTAFRVWMFRLMRNLWIDRLRRSDPAFSLTDLTEADTPSVGCEQTVVNRLAVQQAFMALEKHHRDVLALVDIGGFSYDETAELLDIPRGTVMSRVSRARSALSRLLAEDPQVVPLPLNRSGRLS